MIVPFTLKPMQPEHWDAVRAIYQEGIATRLATFETEAPDWASWDARHRPDCRFVAAGGDVVTGWAALSPVSSREVYEGVAEVSVYVTPSAWGRGVGKQLLSELVRASEGAGIWTLQAAIFPENAGSGSLHERCGFRVVGTRRKLARLDGEWRDVPLQERRSKS